MIVSIISFVVVIGILVFVHEFGHFIAARFSKMRVDIFSFGMGPRLIGWNKKTGLTFMKLSEEIDLEGGCDYRISAFPFGGYVKIAGMIDESMDTKYLESEQGQASTNIKNYLNYSDKNFILSEPKPWEFRSKNAFLKALTISAGVILNFAFAIAIFAGIILYNGKTIYNTTAIAGVDKGSVAEKIGFVNGDKVISINGKSVTHWDNITYNLALEDFGAERQIVVERNGTQTTLTCSAKMIIDALNAKEPLGLMPQGAKVVFSTIAAGKPASMKGLQPGDTLLAINGEPIISSSAVTKTVNSNASKPLFFEWKRGEQILKDTITPTSEGLIGVMMAQIYNGPVQIDHYSIFQALKFGYDETVNSVTMFFKAMSSIFGGHMSVKQVFKGPVGIAEMAGERMENGIISFLLFMAQLSVSLAIINILPFPALDGGHLIFIIVEAVIRREVPIKIKMAIQQVGIFALLALMAFMVYNDIFG